MQGSYLLVEQRERKSASKSISGGGPRTSPLPSQLQKLVGRLLPQNGCSSCTSLLDLLREHLAITGSKKVAADFPADGRCRSSQVARDRPQRAAPAEASRTLPSFRE